MNLETFFDFCSGIGGGRLGLERIGLKCVGSSDTSRLANTTYDLLFPNKTDTNYGNLKKFDHNKAPKFDVMIAGFPCQSFSVIGRQTGTKDPRGQIIYYLIDILEKSKPKVFILENVKGLITHDKGKTFKKILKSLKSAGYTVFHKVLNSIDYGIPHMRQRVFIVGFRDDLEISEKDFIWPIEKERVEISNFLRPNNNEMSEEDKIWFLNDYLQNDKNKGKFELENILNQENLIVDTRMSDLRLYENRMPTLRAHRDGIYYVKNKKMYYLTGCEALLFQGFSEKHVDRVKNKVSNRHLLKQVGNAMTANVVEELGKSIIRAMEGNNMTDWRRFELECVDYLNQKYGNYFEHLGFSDSTTSDIKYENGDKYFFIEAKMPQAQSGQFVLLPDLKNREFIFSPRNKSEIDENVEFIIDLMNSDFEKYQNAGTRGENIDLPHELVSDWIINSYKRLGVKFFITKGSDFIIFPIESYGKYFDISCKYRVKKSGSSSVPKSRQKEVMETLKRLNFEFDEIEDFMIKSTKNLDKLRFSVNDADYMIRAFDENIYRIRKLSNTYNANVIFSINLKNQQEKNDLLEFELAL